MNLKRFDGWEQESLKLFRKQDLDILLDNFVAEDKQEDFLHNLADMLFRLNLTKHNKDFTATPKVCPHCNMNISIRNPSGYCDHLYYPNYCEVCKKREGKPL